jgi:hypothetical protein
MSEKPRIVIGEDELADAPGDGTAPSAPTQAPPPANRGLPPVGSGRPLRPSGLTPQASGSLGGILNDPRWSALIAAAVGITLGWAVTEIFDVYESLIESAFKNAESEADLKRGFSMASGVWIGIVGLVFGLVYLTFDRMVAGAWEEAGRRAAKAAIPVFIACFVSGYLAQTIYVEMASGGEAGSGEAYLARMIGWAIFGGGIGLAIGLVDRSKQRAINGALGGLGGGAVGGLVFEWITSEEMFGISTGRLVALLAVGLAIAYAIRLVETARREAWLSIVAGGMAGKEFIVYHDITRIGASPECEIFLLKDSAVEKQHARIIDRDGQRTLIATGPVLVNGTQALEQVLRSGDQIQIGNTVISYSERALAPAVA